MLDRWYLIHKSPRQLFCASAATFNSVKNILKNAEKQRNNNYPNLKVICESNTIYQAFFYKTLIKFQNISTVI